MNFEWFVSLRYLKAKRKQSFISLITIISVVGVAVGVTALIVVMAVFTGFSEGLRDKILGINSHLVVQKIGDTISNYRALENELKRLPGVTGATSYLVSQIMITSREGGGTGAVLRAIDPTTVSEVLNLSEYMTAGQLTGLLDPVDNGNQRPGIILGKELAFQLRTVVGDRVRLLLAEGPLTPMGVIPKVRTFEVKGIFQTGMYEYDSAIAFVALKSAQDFLGIEDSVHGVELRLADIYQARTLADTIAGQLGFDYSVRDWIRTNRNLFSALKLEKAALSVTVALIVLVAAFNIVSTLIMVVMEKNKDIAILKSMGATAANIMRIFIYEGLIIGCTGTVLGVAGGLGLCELLRRYKFIKLPEVYPMSTLPVKVEPLDIALIALAAIIITLAATAYPSWQAAKVDPAVALRYE